MLYSNCSTHRKCASIYIIYHCEVTGQHAIGYTCTVYVLEIFNREMFTHISGLVHIFHGMKHLENVCSQCNDFDVTDIRLMDKSFNLK